MITTLIVASIIGSYLNVFIYRYHTNESSVIARSHCPHCYHTLKFSEMIPIVSYIQLKGKCHYCHHSISFQYPMVECLNIVGWYGIYMIAEEPYTYILYIVVSIFILMSFIDLKYLEMPDELQVLYAFCTFIYIFTYPNDVTMHVLGGFFAGTVFLLLYIVTHRSAIGGGDVKFMYISGCLLGLQHIWIALLFACLSAMLIEVIVYKCKRVQIPFAPYLCFGVYACILCFI